MREEGQLTITNGIQQHKRSSRKVHQQPPSELLALFYFPDSPSGRQVASFSIATSARGRAAPHPSHTPPKGQAALSLRDVMELDPNSPTTCTHAPRAPFEGRAAKMFKKCSFCSSSSHGAHQLPPIGLKNAFFFPQENSPWGAGSLGTPSPSCFHSGICNGKKSSACVPHSLSCSIPPRSLFIG